MTTDNTVKKPQQWHFKFATTKRLILTRNKSGQGLVRGEATYCTDLGAPKPIMKKGKGLNTMNPAVKELGVPMNPKKVIDVKELLSKHFGPEWRTREDLAFFRDLIPCGEDMVGLAGDVSDEENDDPMEHDVVLQSDGLYLP